MTDAPYKRLTNAQIAMRKRIAYDNYARIARGKTIDSTVIPANLTRRMNRKGKGTAKRGRNTPLPPPGDFDLGF